MAAVGIHCGQLGLDCLRPEVDLKLYSPLNWMRA